MPSRHRNVRKKPYVHHTPAEKLHLKRLKRKKGPSAMRRRERRHEVLETLPCGCKRTRVQMIECLDHAFKKVAIELFEAKPDKEQGS